MDTQITRTVAGVTLTKTAYGWAIPNTRYGLTRADHEPTGWAVIRFDDEGHYAGTELEDYTGNCDEGFRTLEDAVKAAKEHLMPTALNH